MDFEKRRPQLVERYIAHRGVRSPLVLSAMGSVPREAFLPAELREFAYDDSPLPIAEGQTISQPYIVAMMTEALELQGGEKVLEIGTGSGYAAAVLSRIAEGCLYGRTHRSTRGEIRGYPREVGLRQCACPARGWNARLARTRAVRCNRGRGRRAAGSGISEIAA